MLTTTYERGEESGTDKAESSTDLLECSTDGGGIQSRNAIPTPLSGTFARFQVFLKHRRSTGCIFFKQKAECSTDSRVAIRPESGMSYRRPRLDAESNPESGTDRRA